MKPILLNTRDAAALCGVTIKRWRTWNVLGKIPSPLRIGKGFFWKYDELIQWIEAGCPERKNWAADTAKKIGPRTSKPAKTR